MSGVELEQWLIEAVAHGSYAHPHDVLGQHPTAEGLVVRALRPLARAVTVVRPDAGRLALTHIGHGLWAGAWPAGTAPGPYAIETEYEDAPTWLSDDPYRFTPSVGELDLYLWGEGRHEQLWHWLGAQVKEHEGAHGTGFAVWAPHARAARIVGDFNGWDGRQYAMRRLGNGIWELFVPGLGPGSRYKFELLTDAGWVLRADPMARQTEVPPATASIIGHSQYQWGDAAWLTERQSRNPHTGPMSVYELHLGSWKPGLSYRELADELIPYVTSLGFTHVEFLPVAEHPFGGSWGYQVTGYYAPTSRFGDPDDFRFLVDRLHQAGIGVIVDWVPAHFPKDEWALARFDGTPLYEHSNPRMAEHPDWGTLVFDFGNPQVRNFLVANALYWFEEFHVDGLRVDAVASMLYLDYSRGEGQWVPNQFGGRDNLEAIAFLQEATATAYRRNPGIVMIAEESTAWDGVTRPTSSGGLGFGLKWNMGWMHDSLEYMHEDPLWRAWHHDKISFSFIYAFSENFILPISHDEVVHGKGSLLAKMPGDQWQKLANVRAFLAFMWAHPGKQLLFMGCEFGQPSEWSEQRGLDWWILEQPAHRGLQTLVSQLNRVYRETPALWALDHSPAGLQWIANDPERNIIAFLRRSPDGEQLACLVNFSGAPVGPYRVGLPHAGRWDEVLNTDAVEFGGSGVGNLGSVVAEEIEWHGLPASVELTLPPLGAVWLRGARAH